VATDERLRQEIERASRLADPSGVYEELIRRKERRRIARKLQAGVLAVLVVGGSMTGVYGLSRVFNRSDGGAAAPTVGNGRIAYVTHEEGSGVFALNSTIHTVNPDGSDPIRLADIPGMIGGLDWAPEGTRLAFTAPREEPADVALFVMGADGSGLREVGGSNLGSPSWSPDGTRIAYLDDWRGTTAIYVLDVSTGERSRVTGEDLDVATPDWSPDGTSIVFAAEEPDVLPEFIDLFKVDLETLEIEQLTDAPEPDFDPEWSPDGTKIVFRSRRDRVLPQGQCCDPYDEIYVMNANGTQQTRLTFDESIDQSPVWSPDGLKIAYSSQCCLETAAIIIMDPDGSDPRRLPIGAVEFAWQPVPTEPVPTETTSPEAPPTPSPSPPVGEDIGLGFPVCNVSSIKGRLASPDANATAFVATKAHDLGGCPQPDDAFNVVAIDTDQDGFADTSYGPIECTLACRAFSAPDVDGDGTDELLVVQDGGAVVGLRLYDIVSTDSELAIVPANVAEPGDPQGGFEPSQQAILWLGGDAFELYALQCGEMPAPDGPGVIATAAESLPHDSPDAEWHAHQTTLVLRDDGLLHVVDVRDFTEPVSADPDGPSFRSGETLCGSNLGPAVPIP
jgi:WD40-like Beta Propeller Repeat